MLSTVCTVYKASSFASEAVQEDKQPHLIYMHLIIIMMLANKLLAHAIQRQQTQMNFAFIFLASKHTVDGL
jgi:hypothetical protein